MDSKKPRIFLIEDDKTISLLIENALKNKGYDVVCVDNGKDALDSLTNERFDLIILDLILPEIDGLKVLEKMRLDNNHTPVIIISGKTSPMDRVEGLKRGANDYLIKPFDLEELVLRINLRLEDAKAMEASPAEVNEISFNGNTVNFETFVAKTPRGDYNLTKKEGKLLKLLWERKGKVVSRKEILHFVWGYDVAPTTRTIDNFILSFRKYFEEDPKDPQCFLSIRGVGYKFLPEGEII